MTVIDIYHFSLKGQNKQEGWLLLKEMKHISLLHVNSGDSECTRFANLTVFLIAEQGHMQFTESFM